MKHLYHWLLDYFAFSRTEMRGVLLLTLLGSVLFLSPFVYKPWFKKEYHHELSDQKMLETLVMTVEAQGITQADAEKESYTLFAFDPNSADQSSLILLGIPGAVAEKIIRYREKGGVFRKKRDLLKIYGFPEELFQRIAAYIDLPREITSSRKLRTVTTIQPFDINLADSIQLVQLRGIGSVLSTRIIKFRSALGGFYSLIQLQEVYGISDEALEALNTYTFVSQNFTPAKLNLNTADVRVLGKHPYISYDMAKAIVHHRKTYGAFSKLQDLKEVHLIDDNTFAKLLPYVTI